MDENSLDLELNNSFISPAKMWQGQELAPYTEGSRLIMSQVRNKEDSGIFFIYSFLFIHLELKKDRKALLRLAWNIEEFRSRVMDFACTIKDSNAATAFVSSIFDEASKAQYEIVDTTGGLLAPPGNA
jgi:hypothetical protein